MFCLDTPSSSYGPAHTVIEASSQLPGRGECPLDEPCPDLKRALNASYHAFAFFNNSTLLAETTRRFNCRFELAVLEPRLLLVAAVLSRYLGPNEVCVIWHRVLRGQTG